VHQVGYLFHIMFKMYGHKTLKFIKLSAVYQAQSISTLNHYMLGSHSSWDVFCKIKNEETYLHMRILSFASRWPHLSTPILKHFNTLVSLWYPGLPHYLLESCHHFGGICFFPLLHTEGAGSSFPWNIYDIGNWYCWNAIYKVQLFVYSSAWMRVII
jgi:hypothetical protein